jgi:hypothetical protein
MELNKFESNEKFETICTAVMSTNIILIGLTNIGRVYYKVGVAGVWTELPPPETRKGT